MNRTARTCLLAASVAACLTQSPAPGAEIVNPPKVSPPDLTPAPELSWSSASRVVVIDGREVRVTVSAFLVSITTSTGSTANVSVRLEALDGQPLPGDLSAEHIRLRRANQPSRVVQRDLINVDLDPNPTPQAATFALERGFQTAARGARFRVSVRLRHGDVTLPVNLGLIRVNTNTLVNTDPVDGGTFTPAIE